MDQIIGFINYFILGLAQSLVSTWQPAILIFGTLFLIFQLIRIMGLAKRVLVQFSKHAFTVTDLVSGEIKTFSTEIAISELKTMESKDWKVPKAIQHLAKIDGFFHNRCVINSPEIAGKTIGFHLN